MAARRLNGASVIRSAVKTGDSDELVRAGAARGVVILLTDGVDFGSPVSPEQLFRTIESANVGIIHSVRHIDFAPAPQTYRVDP